MSKELDELLADPLTLIEDLMKEHPDNWKETTLFWIEVMTPIWLEQKQQLKEEGYLDE